MHPRREQDALPIRDQDASRPMREPLQDYVARQARPRNGGRQPHWLEQKRQEGLASLIRAGFPTTRNEEWKYTDVTPLTRVPFEAPSRDTEDGAMREAALLPAREHALAGSITLVFVNGRCVGPLDPAVGWPDGLTVSSLAEALYRADPRIEQCLGQIADPEQSAFTALNTALIDDGAFVAMAAGKQATRPVQLLFLHTGTDAPSAVHLRNLVLADPASHLEVIETHISTGQEPTLSTAVTEVFCAAGAHVQLHKVHRADPAAYHVSAIHASQQADSVFTSLGASMGGRLTRFDTSIRLGAKNAECSLYGLLLANGQQHVDYHTTVEHGAPHGTSRQLYKTVLDDNAHGVFNGKVLVCPDAQKTDAAQSSRTLLLSDAAVIHTKPQLEIFADDVRCTHGATVGHLDEEELFYLRTRGLDPQVARGLLIRAFCAEVLEPVRLPSLVAWFEQAICAQLPSCAAGGVSP